MVACVYQSTLQKPNLWGLGTHVLPRPECSVDRFFLREPADLISIWVRRIYSFDVSRARQSVDIFRTFSGMLALSVQSTRVTRAVPCIT